ncbi:MAG: serine/threonine protein kinase, partial [Mycobacterium sp.]
PPVTSARARPTAGTHRPPPPRQTFSPGQRALLWAAGVLGALAIIIAVLIVVNAQDQRDRPVQQETSTSTTVIGVPPEPPPSAEPSEPQ